jgi:hypothetical protein
MMWNYHLSRHENNRWHWWRSERRNIIAVTTATCGSKNNVEITGWEYFVVFILSINFLLLNQTRFITKMTMMRFCQDVEHMPVTNKFETCCIRDCTDNYWCPKDQSLTLIIHICENSTDNMLNVVLCHFYADYCMCSYWLAVRLGK